MASTVAGAAFGDFYGDPFRSASVSAERIDMGADFQGRAGDPVYALGPGRVLAAGNQWAGAVGAPTPGTWIAYELSEGPLRGRIIYAAEDITPAVSPGQRVTADTVIGRFTGAGQLETGFAAPPGTTGLTAAAAAGQQASGSDPGARPTAFGIEISKILTELGAPSPGKTASSGGPGLGLPGASAGCAVVIVAALGSMAALGELIAHALGA